MESRRAYKIHEFAELAGVTVKALRLYDRLGLLKPMRTEAGYRTYKRADLERLEQIIALKFLGLPLKQIRTLLERGIPELADALRTQRSAIEKKQALLARAIRVIRAAEASITPDNPLDLPILKTIIETINMQDGIDMMKKYYTEQGWEQRRRYYEEGPSPEWLAVYRDAAGLLNADPGSPEAQALADRWLELSVRAYRGDPEVQIDSQTAWADRDNWPEAMKQRIAEMGIDKITAFVEQAAICARKRYFSVPAWTRFVELRRRAISDPEAASRFWQAHVDLFRDALNEQGADPRGKAGQEIAARWKDMLETESGGDAGIKAGLLTTWSDRASWSATLRWRMEGLSTLPAVSFDEAADFIDRAVAAQRLESE